MIWESRYWKGDLLRFADRLRWARMDAPALSSRTYVTIEKSVLLGAFTVRRLAESHKFSGATPRMLLRVTHAPTTGGRVTLLNNHRLDELYEFKKGVRSRQPLWHLCNQAIHAYCFGTYLGRTRKRVSGVFIASDWQRHKALFAIPLVEFERAFRKAGRDYPSRTHWSYDEKKGDYEVSTAVRARLLPSPAHLVPAPLPVRVP